MEKHSEHLRKSIEGLKPSEAPDIWSSIQMELDSQEEQNKKALLKAILRLKVHSAPDVWLDVSSQLEKRRTLVWRYVSIAASIVLVSLIAFITVFSDPRETISHSSEEVDLFEAGYKLPSIPADTDDMILSYIKENCTRLAVTCQDSEFKELLETYIELNKTKEELNRAIEINSNQSKLMKYLIKVEKNQTEVGKNMLKKMRST